MTTTETDLLATTKEYLKAIERGITGDELSMYYAENAEQIEYPNRLAPNGATRNLAALKEAAEKGKGIVTSQQYEIREAYVNGNTVILETTWTARLSIPLGKIPPGEEVKAYFAQFIEYEDGKIIRQRTYDCFEPF